ncbi:CG1620 [Drosophila busckii]|uniref:CG1620 n=1 Tax=Drosophila busckii TaxID=30019 RepID=A0A0M4EFX1_DROBS|nr:CG1620 [Drosophila busckii]
MAGRGRELTISPTKRERRKSPAISYGADSSCSSTTHQPPPGPMSPTSVADTTFEPTIDMMVNDFDDEATLNEEEALADMEAHNPDDEIATLREESEMPIEELLAKYAEFASTSSAAAAGGFKPTGGSSSSRRRRKRAQPGVSKELEDTPCTSAESMARCTEAEEQQDDIDSCVSSQLTDEFNEGLPADLNSKRRSHLMDLYPDESFNRCPEQSTEQLEAESFTPLQTLLEQVEVEEEDEDSDSDLDDTRKIIMVGVEYQADIPDGLSQYGDILPYENEDQLIWAPSQVSEREVEEYLAKIQETKVLDEANAESQERAEMEELPPVVDSTTMPAESATVLVPVVPPNSDRDAVVKDNEQALHLLVQCGYDFKEALRRKRMNVLPLSDTMSRWSEEECQKFEEGIHKFGKDFYQIRQHQVRTRTMRELVQFYYLWKKSERRDQSFLLNDTIDHMDVFLNEGVERAGNGNGNGNGVGTGTSRKRSASLALDEDNEQTENVIDSI